jgi:hypothetical protein
MKKQGDGSKPLKKSKPTVFSHQKKHRDRDYVSFIIKNSIPVPVFLFRAYSWSLAFY